MNLQKLHEFQKSAEVIIKERGLCAKPSVEEITEEGY